MHSQILHCCSPQAQPCLHFGQVQWMSLRATELPRILREHSAACVGHLTIPPVETAVSTGREDTMASPELLLFCFKQMVKAGTEFVSFSFSKTFVMQKNKNHKCQHVPTSWPPSNPTKNKCRALEEFEKAKEVTQRATWPFSPCFWLKARLNLRGWGPAAVWPGSSVRGCGGRAQVQGPAVCALVGAGTVGALWAEREGW